ncbi:MerR family transcriptional regulator [Streptomonospora algeriensis]|uniref:MerR family transcriptional regulator n=1 Tax=Streptomonospora algeriensis TaxID=995084 RepID=A0ABW3BJX7_9ACTN
MSTAPAHAPPLPGAADRPGLFADTLRYSERIGLIDPIPRSAAGRRGYGAEEPDRPELIHRLRRGTGMPIQGMLEYARAPPRGPGGGGAACSWSTGRACARRRSAGSRP